MSGPLGPDRGSLPTEGRHATRPALDVLPTEEALALFTRADREAVDAVEAARPELVRAVDLVTDRLRAGGRLVYVGAGTSGRLGVLDASECPPTFQSDPDQVRACIAGGLDALVRAVEGAEDDEREGAGAVAALDVGPRDVVLGITAGGTTPYVHAALREARARGAATVFLACVPRALVPDEADVSIRLDTGPELLAGSTRLKAGTATKLVLNALSTLALARLGKVYGDLMVDVDTRSNVKLVDRGARLVSELTGLDRAAAHALLERAGGSVKLAAVLHARSGDVVHARALLDAARGDLRRALADGAPEAQ